MSLQACLFFLAAISAVGAAAFSECATFQERELRERCAPHFLCIGVPKSGTRTLRSLLSLHPQVRMAKQELDFFTSSKRRMSEYADVLPRVWRNESVLVDGVRRPIAVGEKSTWYYTHASAVRVKSSLPSVRILLLLRDPVERSFSQFVETLRERGTRRGKYLKSVPQFPTFDAALRSTFFHLETTKSCNFFPFWTIRRPEFDLHQIRHCVAGHIHVASTLGHSPAFASDVDVKNGAMRHDPMLTSAYAQFVEHWLAVFDASNVLVVSSEEFFRDLPGKLAEIASFLSLAPIDWHRVLAENAQLSNEKAGDKEELLEREGLNTTMTEAERMLLATFFLPFNERLERVLKREFNWTRARLVD